MKKYIIPILAGLALVGCTDKFEEMNTSSTAITKDAVQPGFVLERTFYHGLSNDHQRNFNLYDDHYAHYIAETAISSAGRYEYNDGWGGINWRDFYTDRLVEYWLVDEITTGDSQKAIKAINDIYNVYLWTRIVDRNGDAPYFDEEGKYAAGQGQTLKYSDSEDIYKDLLKRLKNDSDALANTANQAGLGEYDIVYGDDFGKWRKFANTLIMRLSMRLSRTSLANEAKTYFVAAEPLAMNSVADYCRVHCDASIWGDYYDRTAYDWGEARPDAKFMEVMNGTNTGYHTGVVDPRRAILFSEGTGATAGNSTWDGFPDATTTEGAESAYKEAHGGLDSFANLNMFTPDGFYFFNFHNSRKTNLCWTLATYSETLFLKAEAALRGWISGNAEDLYKQAIKANMDELAFCIQTSGGTKTIAAAEQEAYIAALPEFGADKESQLRSIMIQKWIALYNNSCEGWAELRRTGYPEVGVVSYPIIRPSAEVTDGNLVQRMSYPDNEYNTNNVNIPAEYQKGGANYAKRGEKGLFWSLAGKNGTLSKTAKPKNF